jgi:hypothetical protein
MPNEIQPGTPGVTSADQSGSAAQTTGSFTLPTVTPPGGREKTPALMLAVIIASVLAALTVGYIAYAYATNTWPFAVQQYSEDNLLSGLLSKAGEIHSAFYEFSGALSVGERAADAVPFNAPKPSSDLVMKYQRDVTRVRNASSIIEQLSYGYGDVRTYDYKTKSYKVTAGKPYPTVLSSVSYLAKSITDPLTKKPYGYKVTNNGKNFELEVTLETTEALSGLLRNRVSTATTTRVSGNTVTFTKDSGYQYISSELPQPMLATIADSLRSLPPDVSGRASIGATTAGNAQGFPDWRFTVQAEGDIGDLTYRIDVEARKKDSDYYFIINNFPSLLGSITSYKGQWFKITPRAATSTAARSEAESVSSGIAQYEKEYKEQREKAAETLLNFAKMADKEHVFTITKAVRTEKIGGRTLYRYDLVPRKEAVIAFYAGLEHSVTSSNGGNELFDPGLLQYMKSAEFDNVFDYYSKNTWLTVWADAQGYPARIEYKLRVVPSDAADQLKGKQINVTFTLDIKDINMDKTIDVPPNARPFEDLMKKGAED